GLPGPYPGGDRRVERHREITRSARCLHERQHPPGPRKGPPDPGERTLTAPHVFGICGWKNSGKTGLAVRLVEEFTRRGYVVSTVKHAHHDADMDKPGSDSFRHREAGASEVAL